MKTLNLYVLRAFLITFFMAMLVLTFGMTGARTAQVLDVIANGIPVSVFLEFLYYLMPVVFSFTIPWAIMASVMLVFGRLSADCEITAMRACGVSILQVISPILLVTFLISAYCLYLQLEVYPTSLFNSRMLMRNAAVNQPLAMFEPGRPLNYENTIIYISDKDPKGVLKDVQIYVVDPKNRERILQDVTAVSGRLEVDKEKQILTIVLEDCLTIDKSGKEESRSSSKELRFGFNYGKSINGAGLFRPAKYMKTKEVIAQIRLMKQLTPRNRALETAFEVDLNKRIAFALSPIAFLLLGMPLAIRTSRRETSVGLFLSVILAGGFFLSIILCQSFVKFYWIYPQYIVWLPNILFQSIGAFLTYRISQR